MPCVGCCCPAGRHFRDLSAGTRFVHPSSQSALCQRLCLSALPGQGLQHSHSVASPGPSGDFEGPPRCVCGALPCPGLPKPQIFACPGVVLGASSPLRRRDANRLRGTGCQRQSSLILPGCNYSWALGRERFLCVPRTHILRRG